MFTPPKLDKERQDVIDKIISSEQEYIAQLSYLEKFYISSAKLYLSKECEEKVCPSLFAPIYTMMKFNKILLQQISNFPHQIGSIFVDEVPNFKCYLMYATSYFSLLEEFKKEMDQNRQLKRFFDQMDNQSTTDFFSLMNSPIQRISQYVALLQELSKNVPQKDSDYFSLQSAIEKMKELTTKLETSIREDKRKTKLLEIWNEITGWPPDFHFITHEREYIMHGVLKLNGKHTRRLYLFSDLLLITQRSKYKMHIPLNMVPIPWVSSLQGNTFTIALAQLRFTFEAPNESSKIKWVSTISKTIEEIASKRPVEVCGITKVSLKKKKSFLCRQVSEIPDEIVIENKAMDLLKEKPKGNLLSRLVKREFDRFTRNLRDFTKHPFRRKRRRMK